MRSVVDVPDGRGGLEGEFPLMGREGEVRRIGLHLDIERNPGAGYPAPQG